MSHKTQYFRNKITVTNIEPETLWKLKNNKLVLVDDDQYVCVEYEKHKDQFYAVDKPEEL